MATGVIHVDDDAKPGGDGSAKAPYNDIHDAVAAAEGLNGAVVLVHPGRYEVNSTIRVQYSIDLRGSNVIVKDSNDWPTGTVSPGSETRIVGTSALGFDALIAVSRSDGSVVPDVQIRNFTLESRAGANTVDLMRAQRFNVRDNIMIGAGTRGVFTAASSGVIVGNYFSVGGTGTIITAGYPASPADVEFVGNRSVHNGIGGVLLNGASYAVPEIADQLHAVVRANDLSENTSPLPNAFGIRIFVILRTVGGPGDGQSSGNVQATIQGNRIVNNRLGAVIDAGFPYRKVGTICDVNTYSGSFNLKFAGNALSGSLAAPGLIAFTRSQCALNQSQLPLWQYLHSTTFSISDVDGSLAGAWIDHPELDPYVGDCPNDATHESLNNTLVYNGVILPYMRSVPSLP